MLKSNFKSNSIFRNVKQLKSIFLFISFFIGHWKKFFLGCSLVLLNYYQDRVRTLRRKRKKNRNGERKLGTLIKKIEIKSNVRTERQI